MLRIYRSLMGLYPAPYRHQFSDVMITVFQEVQAGGRKNQGPPGAPFTSVRSSGCWSVRSANTCEHWAEPMSGCHFPQGGSRCIRNSVFENQPQC